MLHKITLIIILLSSKCYSQPVTVFVKNGNIWGNTTNGSQVQLTTSGRDTIPILSHTKNYVAFVRKTRTTISSANGFDSSQIWLLNLKTGKSKLLVQSKPDSGICFSTLRGGFDALQFSPGESYLYFLSQAWATSLAVHRINLITGRDELLSNGNSLYVIQNGVNKGCLRVLRSDYYFLTGKPYNSYWLLSPAGAKIKDLGLDKLQQL